MAKQEKYTPLRCHLLRAHVGGGLSIFIETPTGHNIQGWIFDTHELERHYDLVPATGANLPVYETADVMQLIPRKKEEQ